MKLVATFLHGTLFILLVGIVLPVKAQVILWDKFFFNTDKKIDYHYGGGADSQKKAIAADGDGNLFVLIDVGYQESKLTKFRAVDGSVLWEKSFVHGYRIAYDGLGSLYLLGCITGKRTDACVTKISTETGSLVWQSQYKDMAGNRAFIGDIALGSSGILYISATVDTLPFGYQGRVIRLSPTDGSVIWETSLQSLRSNSGSIAVDSANNVVITNSSYTDSGTDWETLKLSVGDGKVLWRQTLNGDANRYDYVAGLSLTGAGDVVVTGSVNSAYNDPSSRTTDIRTIKYSGLDGHIIWDRQTGSANGNDYAGAIAIDSLGELYVSASIGPAGWTIIKYAGLNGAERWRGIYSGIGKDAGYAIASTVDRDNHLVSVGSYRTETLAGGAAAMYNQDTGAPIWQYSTDGNGQFRDVISAGSDIYMAGTQYVAANGTARTGVRIVKLTNGLPLPIIAVSVNGSGKGEVVSAPLGISCSTQCKSSFLAGTKVKLSATPAAGSVFLGWTGAGCIGTFLCELTVANSANVTATFRSDAPATLSKTGGIDLDGTNKSALILENANHDLQAGRLTNNVFQFTSVAGSELGGGKDRVLGAVDFNGDGKSDLAVLQNTVNGFATASQSFGFTDRYNTLRSVKTLWRVDAVGDLDGDGYGDLVWRFTGNSGNIDDTGVSYIWFTASNTSGKSIEQVRKRGGAPLSWTLLGAADLNGDEAADMLYISPGNEMRALMATPNRTCANLSAGTIPAGFTALSFKDFTGNRRGDVLARNPTTGAVTVISLDAIGLDLPPYAGAPDDNNASCTASNLIVRIETLAMPIADPTWTYFAAGDFNGDGLFDVIWKRPDNTLVVWLMNWNGASPTVINNAGTVPVDFTPILQ